jgi:hypothetical protein
MAADGLTRPPLFLRNGRKTMKLSHFILAAALAFGLGTVASASSLPSPAAAIQADTVAEFTKRKGGKGWHGNRGRHYGWNRGRHRGWSRHPRRVYYAPPRRHYGHYRGRHYGWNRHRRPARAVYFRF